MFDQILLFIAALIILDVAALIWGADSRTTTPRQDTHGPVRPDL
jgi:hypothetical protein